MRNQKTARPFSRTQDVLNRDAPSWRGRSSQSLFVVLLLAIVAVSGVLRAEADELEKPTRDERLISKIVAALMQRDHLSSRELDDTISARAFERFIKALDPTKVYFQQSDIDEFKKWEDQLDDQLKSGNFSTAMEVFKRFLQRVDQRTELAVQLVDQEHDFTVDEELITDPDLINFATTDEEIITKWRKRIKYNLLVLQSNEEKTDDDQADDDASDESGSAAKKPPQDPREQLRKRYQSFARRMHQLDTEDVIEMFITAVTSSFDPHTSYMSKGSFENFLIQIGLELEGIGATLQETDDGYTVIRNIVPGGAADTQGELKVEDKIVAVAQGDEEGQRAYSDLLKKHGTEFVDVTGMKLDDVVGMIRGKAGTVVRLSVMSENSSGLHTVQIVREKIKLEDSAAHGSVFEVDAENQAAASKLKIGVIELPSFYASMGRRDTEGRSTTADVKKILEDFKSQDVDAVVLDLRRNGGGSLREAIDCTGLFIDLGPVVQVKSANGYIEKHNDETRGMTWAGPLVVLNSKFSASASEILAGAVQDYNRGVIVGDTTTHGKGTVQSLVNLSQQFFQIPNPPKTFGALKITMQQFYRPNGDSTQKRGVLSDLVLPSITDKMDVTEADLDYPVEFDRIPSATFEQYGMMNPEIKKRLLEKSEMRVTQSEEFKEQLERIKHYVEQKELKSISLNQEKFLQRRRQLNAEKENRDAIEKQVMPNEKIERDYYLDEVLSIAADYVELLGNTGKQKPQQLGQFK